MAETKKDTFVERVISVRRVTKVTKGGQVKVGDECELIETQKGL